MKAAEGAFYFETVAANGVAMRAARNERHVVARRGHPPAEITSHGTRCHDRDPHLALSASKTFVCPKTSTLEVSGWRIGSFTSVDTPVASPPIATEPMHRNEPSRSAIPTVADPTFDHPTGHRRSVGRPGASGIISVHANAVCSAAFQLNWLQADNRVAAFHLLR